MAMLGCVLMPLLPVKLVPSETLPSVNVSYSFPGASARTVEAEVTAPLEAMLAVSVGREAYRFTVKKERRTGHA